MINFLLISCQKDDITWKIKRLSPKDAKLEVAEIIYSNNCSSFSEPIGSLLFEGKEILGVYSFLPSLFMLAASHADAFQLGLGKLLNPTWLERVT